MRPITVTLPPDLLAAVQSGAKTMISTRRNPRKNRYFERIALPDMAKINGELYRIARIEAAPDEWRVHLASRA